MNQSTQPKDSDQFKAELPQTEPAQIDRIKNHGFFKLSHSIFADPRLRSLTGDSFKVYLWMSCQAWRFPNSNGVIRAAVAFISKGTDISTATVSRCIKSSYNRN